MGGNALDDPQAYVRARAHRRERVATRRLPRRGEHRSVTVVTFRSSGPELEVLRLAGHPFFKPGWGANVVGMVLEAGVDWEEVAELVTESYCIMAPKKLAERVDRPME